jgi:hypothetical protein
MNDVILGRSGRNNRPNVAIGNVVVQQNNTNTAKIGQSETYKNCLNNPSITANWAPPAYTQFERVLFGIKTIETKDCPADFAKEFDSYKNSYQQLVELSKSYPELNTSDWTNIVKLKIPGNENEKTIINNDASLGIHFSNMISQIKIKTGWCPSANFNSYYHCR